MVPLCFFTGPRLQAVLLSGVLCGFGCKSNDGAGAPGPSVQLGAPVEGIATYYAATGGGACGFEPGGGDLQVAALNAEEYDVAAFCGACAEVAGESGTTVVRIVDKCPECKAGHLDLSQEAFERVAPLEKGRVGITWKWVTCPVSGNVRYHFKDGSSQWWTALQVRNHRLPIRALEWKRGGDWARLERQDYNYFVAPNGVGPGPFSIRVTAFDGQQLEDTVAGVEDGEEVEGAGQFR